MRFPRADGGTMWAQVSAVRLHLPPDSASILLQVEDITARREAERRIIHMAGHDALTDLPNRTLFRARLDARLGGGAPCAILWLDLDRFKVVNDTLGHAAGDTLLCEVGRRMSAVLRPGDTLARLGGDEFAVLLSGGDPVVATQAASRLVEAMQAPIRVADRPMHVGVSIGVVLAPGHGEDADTLMARADRALYSAKAAGRSTFRLYDPAMDEAAAERRGLELDLRLGLDRGEFVLHYQPIVTTAERRTVCREALVRWHHPTRGLVSPGAFIPLAEETGMIERLGAWILRQACRDAATWTDGARVAVNVSAAQVRHGPLIAAIQAALHESGLGSDRLEIEITESLLVDGEAVDLLLALRRLGLRIALDDFGRLLVPELPAPLPLRRDQDRPLLHRRHRQSRHRRDRARGGRHRRPTRGDGHRRGRRDRGPARGGPAGGVHGDAGLPVRAAGAFGGGGRLTRRTVEERTMVPGRRPHDRSGHPGTLTRSPAPRSPAPGTPPRSASARPRNPCRCTSRW